DPYVMEYEVEQLVENKVIRVDFHLGFRIQPRIGIMLKRVVREMISNKELKVDGSFSSLDGDELKDFKFVILERFLSYDNQFKPRDSFVLNTYFSILRLARSDSEAYGIDLNQAVFEKVPLVVAPVTNITLTRTAHRAGRNDD